MKTVFRVGMEVYDQFYFPNKKGKVISILEKSDFPVFVEIEGDCKMFQYTLDGRFFNHIIKTLSTRPYKIETQGFEQKAPAPTYEEALKEAHRKGDYYYQPYHLEVPSKELAEATMALLKLLFLRDYYNEGWQPDWNNSKQTKYTIEVYLDEMWCDNYTTVKKILSFRTDKIRDKFLEEQKELLEIAKPLL